MKKKEIAAVLGPFKEPPAKAQCLAIEQQFQASEQRKDFSFNQEGFRLCLRGLFLLFSLILLLRANPALGKERPIRMGCVVFAKEASRVSFQRLSQYLREELKRDIELICRNSYSSIMTDLIQDRLDLAMLSPLLLLETKALKRLRPIAYGIFRSSGFFSYKSVILVKRESPIYTLSDLKGKRMAFVDSHSVSGFGVPRRALKQRGIGLKDLREVKFLGNHVDTVQEVLEGGADAAATYDDLIDLNEELRNRRSKLRRLWTSSFVIPADCFAATPRISLSLRKQIREALLCYFAAQKRGRTERNPLYEGFVPADPSLYKDLEKFLKRDAEKIK